MHRGRVQNARIESVELDASGPEHEFVIVVRDLERPGCLFERREPAFDPDFFHEDATVYAGWIHTHLEEDIEAIGYGLPQECSPGETTPF
jgi:hypothetical protein